MPHALALPRDDGKQALRPLQCLVPLAGSSIRRQDIWKRAFYRTYIHTYLMWLLQYCQCCAALYNPPLSPATQAFSQKLTATSATPSPPRRCSGRLPILAREHEIFGSDSSTTRVMPRSSQKIRMREMVGGWRVD